MGLTELRSSGHLGFLPFGGSRGASVFLPFPIPRGRLHSWIPGPASIRKACDTASSSLSLTLTLVLPHASFFCFFVFAFVF